MNWTKRDTRIYTAIAAVTFADLVGRTRTTRVAFRIDGRRGDYRVDTKTLSFEPWEAIDGGRGFRTVAEAKTFARRWRRAACDQRTLSPSDVERPLRRVA